MSDEVNPKRVRSTFSDLPGDCISNIISLMSPKDACRVAAVSRAFKSAADSNTVWQRFLPHNCNEIVSRSSSPVVFETKKQLYFLLHNSDIFLDGGKMSFTFTEYGTLFMMGARTLQIAEIDNPAHWEWTPSTKSRFGEVAELRSVNRLEIRGIMPARMLSPNTHYSASFVYWVYDNVKGLYDVPLKTSIKFVKEDGTEINVKKNTIVLGDNPEDSWLVDDRVLVCGREMGDFVIDDEEDNFDIHFEFSETEYLNEKKGLFFDGIIVNEMSR